MSKINSVGRRCISSSHRSCHWNLHLCHRFQISVYFIVSAPSTGGTRCSEYHLANQVLVRIKYILRYWFVMVVVDNTVSFLLVKPYWYTAPENNSTQISCGI